MSIDAIHRSRRYEAAQPTDDDGRAKTTAPSPRREAPELERPIHYPRELFAGTTYTKKPGSFYRSAPDDRRPHVVERSAPRTIQYAATSLAPRATTPPGATIHTSHPQEVGVVKTTLATPEMVALIRKHWPELTATGARTLAAQWAAETGFGKDCYSYNFGNVKCIDPKQGHMYLGRTWEVPKSEAEAARMRVAGGHDADDAFKAKKGVDKNMTVIVFHPPHPTTRFRAFKTADEGMAFWCAFKKGIEKKCPGYIDALNRGDIATVAHLLDKAKYATMPEAQYRDAMIRCRKTIDGQLGATS